MSGWINVIGACYLMSNGHSYTLLCHRISLVCGTVPHSVSLRWHHTNATRLLLEHAKVTSGLCTSNQPWLAVPLQHQVRAIWLAA